MHGRKYYNRAEKAHIEAVKEMAKKNQMSKGIFRIEENYYEFGSLSIPENTLMDYVVTEFVAGSLKSLSFMTSYKRNLVIGEKASGFTTQVNPSESMSEDNPAEKQVFAQELTSQKLSFVSAGFDSNCSLTSQ